MAEEEENPFVNMDFKGGGSFGLGYMKLNMGGFKEEIARAGYPELEDGMLVYGGGSLIGFRDGLRCGGFGYGGEVVVEGANGGLSQLNFAAGGADLEYGFVLQDKLDIGIGMIFGGGTYELTLRKNTLQNINEPNQIHLTNTFFIVGPKVTLQYQVVEWCTIQGIINYIYSIGNDQWKDVNYRTDAVPPLRVNGTMIGVNLQLMY